MTREEVINELNLLEMFAGTPKAAEAVRLATAALREQEEKRWIPVTERLPKTTGKFLVVKREERHNTIGANWYFVQCPPDGIGGWNSGMDITHWMPLPVPPKEGE